MEFTIEKKVPYLVIGAKPLENIVEKVDKETFWAKMIDAIGEDKFTLNEQQIKHHLLASPDNFIEFGDLIFRCR